MGVRKGRAPRRRATWTGCYNEWTMPTSPLPSSPRSVACPACGQRLGVRDADVGKRGKCTQCGEVFLIGTERAERVAGGGKAPGNAGVKEPTQGAGVAKPQAAPARPAPPKPATVTFACELCETRLTGQVADIGKAMKCPDCG